MDWGDIVRQAVVVDLGSSDKDEALAELCLALSQAHPELSADQVLSAVTAREAVASTFIQPGLAIPHARIEWPGGGVALAVGRRPAGIDYDTVEGEPVRLLLLLLGSEAQPHLYLEALAGLARSFRSPEFIDQILAAADDVAVRELLAGGAPGERRSRWDQWLGRQMLRHAVELGRDMGAQALMVNIDLLGGWDDSINEDWPRPIILLTRKSEDVWRRKAPDAVVVGLPRAPLARPDQIRLGLLPALAAGVIKPHWPVVCLVGLSERGALDTILIQRPGEALARLVSPAPAGSSDPAVPEVLLRVLELSLELAAEGREGRPVGGMFLIGDSDEVLRHGRQLIINPFHGYPADVRNLMDPSLAETVKEFAALDGAFVVSGDGVIRTAGTYLRPQVEAEGLPAGLGTRHQVAAAVSRETHATAVVLSQSTGTVAVFRGGRAVLTLERSRPGLI